MLNTFEKKKQYIQQTRLKNYQASLVLEGFQVSSVDQPLTKAQLLKNINKPIKTKKVVDKYSASGDQL